MQPDVTASELDNDSCDSSLWWSRSNACTAREGCKDMYQQDQHTETRLPRAPLACETNNGHQIHGKGSVHSLRVPGFATFDCCMKVALG